jgi:hypothetical protein
MVERRRLNRLRRLAVDMVSASFGQEKNLKGIT